MALSYQNSGGAFLPPDEGATHFAVDSSFPEGGATIYPFRPDVQKRRDVVSKLLADHEPFEATASGVDYLSNAIDMDERRPSDFESVPSHLESSLGEIDQVRAIVGRLVADEDRQALIELSGIMQEACVAVGVTMKVDSILTHPSTNPYDSTLESKDVAVSLGHNSGLPAWFVDLKAKLESGAIPHYAGKWHDGDPVDFLLSHYKEAVDARFLTQAHLKALDRKLYDSVKHTYRNSGRELTEVLPVAVVFSRKFMH